MNECLNGKRSLNGIDMKKGSMIVNDFESYNVNRSQVIRYLC